MGITAKEVFDRRYEKYRMEGNPAIPLEAKSMIFAAMEAYNIINNDDEQSNVPKTNNKRDVLIDFMHHWNDTPDSLIEEWRIGEYLK